MYHELQKVNTHLHASRSRTLDILFLFRYAQPNRKYSIHAMRLKYKGGGRPARVKSSELQKERDWYIVRRTPSPNWLEEANNALLL